MECIDYLVHRAKSRFLLPALRSASELEE